jgi:hypothetical protein
VGEAEQEEGGSRRHPSPGREPERDPLDHRPRSRDKESRPSWGSSESPQSLLTPRVSPFDRVVELKRLMFPA